MGYFFIGGAYRNRTDESEFCRLVPYRLANSPYKVEQVTGIGPVTKPWQGLILPLNYTCISDLIIITKYLKFVNTI